MFTYIKTSNIYRKSQLNLEQARLQDRKLDIQSQLSDFQEKQASMADAFTQMLSGASSQNSSIFNQAVSNANALVTNAQDNLTNAQSHYLPSDVISVFENQVTLAKAQSEQAQKDAYNEYQKQVATVASLTQAFKKLQETQEKTLETKLNKEEAQIDIRLNQISTELTSLEGETESASQAESQWVKNTTPKY